mgnify:CR=1 FL=1
MRLIILSTFFLFPLIGFASSGLDTTNSYDTSIESKKETIQEYKIRIQKQLYSNDNELYSNVNNLIYLTKRKNFVIGGGYNFYSKEKERNSLKRLDKDELINNPSIHFGGILYDHFYIGMDITKGGHAFLETRLYTPKINLYLCRKWGNNIDKYAIGYDYFITKNISINTEGSYYSYSNSWTRINIVDDPNAFFGFDIITNRFSESLSGTKLSMKIQIHF